MSLRIPLGLIPAARNIAHVTITSDHAMRLPPPVWIGQDPADNRVGGSVRTSEGSAPRPRDGAARPTRHATLRRALYAEMEAPSRDRDGEPR